MRKTELEKYRRRLMTLRDRLTGNVGSMLEAGLGGESRSGGGGASGDEADQGNDHWDAELALNLSANSNETINLVDDALKRIEDGSYGICLESGEKIAKDRLDAIPYTPYCVEAAAALESHR